MGGKNEKARFEKVLFLSLFSMIPTQQDKALGACLISKGRGAGMCVHKDKVALSPRFLRSIVLSKHTLMVFLLIKNLYKLSLLHYV